MLEQVAEKNRKRKIIGDIKYREIKKKNQSLLWYRENLPTSINVLEKTMLGQHNIDTYRYIFILQILDIWNGQWFIIYRN